MGVDIRKPLKEFSHRFLEARDNNINEAETVALLCKFFDVVLGYDEIVDIGHEAAMKDGSKVDLTLKVDGVVKHLVEAKRAGLTLHNNSIRQAFGYASQKNYRWVLLANGVDWNLYHLTFEDGIEYEIAFKVSLEPGKVDDAAEKLALLHKKAVKKGELEEWWKRYSAIRPASIGKALFQECVLKLVRTGIHHDTGLLIDCEDLANALFGMLSDDARVEIGPLKIRHPKVPSKKAASRDAADGDGMAPAAELPQAGAATPVAGKGIAPGGGAP